MSTPVGHTLFGLLGGKVGGRADPSRWIWLAVAVFAANAADLDFAAGLLVGDVNRFHRSASHSLFAAVFAGVLIALFVFAVRRDRGLTIRFGVLTVVMYLSHLLLDALSQGWHGRPSGQRLLWPISDVMVRSPWAPLPGVGHGTTGESFASFLGELLTWQNLTVVLIETAIMVPLFALAWYASDRLVAAT